MVTPTLRLRVTGARQVRSATLLKPSEIARVNRLVVNKLTDAVHRETGGTIPRRAGTSVAGFRRVRAKKNKATARSRQTKGVVWLGGDRIAASFGGKMRNTSGGALAGRTFFKDGFVATMPNGYTSIFKRSQDGKLRQQTIEVQDLDKLARESLDRQSRNVKPLLKQEVEKLIKRKKK